MSGSQPTAWRIFEELARRLGPVSEMARARQRPDVAAVNPNVHLALLAVLVVLLPGPTPRLSRACVKVSLQLASATPVECGPPNLGHCAPWRKRCKRGELMPANSRPNSVKPLILKLRWRQVTRMKSLVFATPVRAGKNFWGSRAPSA